MKLIFNYNYQEKLNNLDQKLQISLVHKQVEAINKTIQFLEAKRPLTTRLPLLGLAPDEVEDFKILSKLPKEVDEVNQLLNNFRSFISRQFGIWCLADLDTSKTLFQQYDVHTGLEIMAGNACWSQALSKNGIEMIATDSFSWAQGSETGSNTFYPTENLNAQEAIKRYHDVDFIICCWAPNFGDSDLQALNAYRQYCKPRTHLFFIGEKNGATNTDHFWKKAQEINNSSLKQVNHAFTNFDFIKERFYEIK